MRFMAKDPEGNWHDDTELKDNDEILEALSEKDFSELTVEDLNKVYEMEQRKWASERLASNKEIRALKARVKILEALVDHMFFCQSEHDSISEIDAIRFVLERIKEL